MKGKSCHTIAEITNLLMMLIVCCSVLYFGEMAAKRNIGFLAVPVLAAIIAACYAMRLTIENFILYGVLHLIPFGLLILVPSKFGKFELLGFYALFFVLDIAYWMKRKTEGFVYIHIAFILIDAIAYLYATVKERYAGMYLFFLLGMAYFLLYYIRLFFANATLLAKERAQDEKMPFSDMLSNSSTVALPFVLLSLLVMLFVRADELDPYLLAAYRFCMSIFMKIVRFVVWLVSLLAGLFFESETLQNPGAVEEGIEQMHHSLLVEILFTILYFSLLAVALYLLIRLVLALLKRIPMKRSLTPEIIEDADMVEIRERIVKSERTKEEKLPKIRKRYKKTIEKAAKHGYGINRAHTVRERAADFLDQRGEDISALSAEYEAFRYSCHSD